MEGQTLESIPSGSSTKHASEFRGAAILGFLENYESVKLSVADPEVHQVIIVLVFGLLVCFASRKTNRTPLLDRQQTEQLKGLAIFLVILGHLWVHVSDNQPLLVLGGDGVTIFLMLSGFGLAVSSGNRCPDARTFAVRRLMRVMMPYWLATAVILALDAILLGHLLSPVDLTLTLLGVNISDATRHLDYARWFVTSILLWYVLFYLAMFLKDKAGLDPLVWLFSFGLALYLFNHYVYSFAYQELAFPAGCALARYRDEITNRFERSRGRWVLGAVILLAGGILYQALMPLVYPKLWPMLFFRFSFQAASIALTAGLIILFGQLGTLGRHSRVLALLGTLSYELFLLHGPLLIKYNPVFGRLPTAFLSLGFLLLLGIVLGLSAGLHRALRRASG